MKEVSFLYVLVPFFITIMSLAFLWEKSDDESNRTLKDFFGSKGMFITIVLLVVASFISVAYYMIMMNENPENKYSFAMFTGFFVWGFQLILLIWGVIICWTRPFR